MSAITLFEEKQVRRAWNKAEEKWYFANVDVIAILTSSDNPQVYWRVMKKRLSDEGNETVSNCNALKMTAADGKQRLTDVAGTEQLLRLIQSIPSPKAEPFKQVDYERLQEIENPELAAKRMRQIYEHVCPHSTPGLPPRHLQPLPRGHRPPPRLRVPAPLRFIPFAFDPPKLASVLCVSGGSASSPDRGARGTVRPESDPPTNAS